jgi:hypothetical protein
MFGLEGIEIAIGLSLMYLTLATICSVIRERAEALLRTRAVDLERGVRELLGGDASLTAKLYNHPLISGLFKGDYDPAKIDATTLQMPRGGNLPSYIPSGQFATALIDIVVKDAGAAGTPEQMRAAVEKIENPAVKRLLSTALDTARGDIDVARQLLENWFNAAMDRVTEWYKRRSQFFILLLSIAVSFAINANTLTIIERLSIDTSLRQALVEQAKNVDLDKSKATQRIAQNANDIDAWYGLGQFGFPIGWADGWPGPRANPLYVAPAFGAYTWDWWWYWVLQPLLGLLLTAFAVSLGAPVWFDIMNRLVSLRSAVRPANTAPIPSAAVLQVGNATVVNSDGAVPSAPR